VATTTTTTSTTTTTTIPTVSAPSFSATPGTYEANSITVEVTSSTLYSGTITISTSTTLKAIALLGSLSSDVTTGRYNLIWWSAIGSGVAGASVNAIAVDNAGLVYVAGSFTTAGGVTASNIAMWDGSSWYPLDDGLNGTVWALAIGDDGHLYAGGEFSASGATTLNFIARWNTATDAWQALDSGLNETVRTLLAITISETDYLICGGDFTGEGAGGGPDPLNYLGVYVYDDFPNWTDLTGGANNIGRAFAYDAANSVTYVGGDFTVVNDAPDEVSANYVAALSGSGATTWSALGAGVNAASVRALLYSSNALFVGGDFTTAGGSTANRIGMWDTEGSSWSALGNGFDDTVRALANDSSYVYAGGDFANDGASSTAYARIARWSLTSGTWSTMGSGLNGNVNAIVVDSLSGRVYVGGQFSLAGGASAFRLAVWGLK